MMDSRDTLGQLVRFLPDEPVPFRFFRAFNEFPHEQMHKAMKSRLFVGRMLDEYFASDSLADKFVRALAEHRAANLKEILESFEFFERMRKRIRGPCIVDLCCGHGLVGILYAMFDRKVEKVILIDSRRPLSFDKILLALEEVAPWVAEKIDYRTCYVDDELKSTLPDGAALLAIHACGRLTDRCLGLALDLQSPIAAMPCCYFPKLSKAPTALSDALGFRLTTDIERTYRLTEANFDVKWYRIPEEITPMNRILLCKPPVSALS